MARRLAIPIDQMAERFFELVDALDIDGISELVGDDCEAVDEISRAWMRGRPAIDAYFAQITSMVENIQTTVHDVHTRTWGETGVVTCVIDQTYRLNGEVQQVTAPTSLILRREGDDWRIALIHTVPLSETTGG